MRSVKTCLKRILGRGSLNFKELTTTLTEVEAMLTSRPLSYVSSNASVLQPLKPSHFQMGKRLASLPPKTLLPQSHATSVSREDMRRRWRYLQKLSTSFWNCWRKDYLMDLESAHTLKVGDVILIKEDNTPRQTWKMGRITELFPGRDGLTCSCTVRTFTGSLLRRPVADPDPSMTLMYPLEIC